jgi:dihydroorotate dehydrogenase
VLPRAALALSPRLLRLLPPETAHDVALAAIRSMPRLPLAVPEGLGIGLAGLPLTHPLGLAAGFDKNAVALAGLLRLGFAFVEAGGVTLRPQAGNPRPRVFRLTADGALVNRLGFNNDGVDRFAAALANRPAAGPERGIVGANLGINKDSTDAAADYALLARRILPLADFITVNVSSPNTAGLRDLQERRALTGVLDAVMGARSEELSGQRQPAARLSQGGARSRRPGGTRHRRGGGRARRGCARRLEHHHRPPPGPRFQSSR